jgi:hypothetical protein
MAGKPLGFWSKELGICPKTLYRWIRDGLGCPDGTVRLSAQKIGGRWRVTEAQVRQFLAQTQPPQPTERKTPPRPTTSSGEELERFYRILGLGRGRQKTPG